MGSVHMGGILYFLQYTQLSTSGTWCPLYTTSCRMVAQGVKSVKLAGPPLVICLPSWISPFQFAHL